MTISLFAGGFALTGVGSRATALGGAFRGLADDPTAMYWNPAGLAFLEGNSVDLGGTFILPSAKWENNGPVFTNIDGYTATEYEAESKLHPFPSLFLTMAKHPKLKYGFGAYVPYGLGTTWDAYEPPAYLAGFTDFPQNEMMSSIAIIDFHPTVSYQILPFLSAGAGVSVMYGMIDLANLRFTSLTVPVAMDLPTTTDLSGSGIGIGGNLGLIFKPMRNLSIGVSGKIPTDIVMSGDIEAYTWIPPTTKLGGTSDIEATLKLPGEAGIGFSYMVTPKWTVNLDYAYTMWDRLEKVVVDLDDPLTVSPTPGDPQLTSAELPFMWENTSRVSLGTEYALGCNKLRLGFFYDQTPIPESTQTPTLSDISPKLSYNFGLGRNIGPIGLDLNVQYVMFSEREVAQGLTNFGGNYNVNSISGNINLGFKF
jgi:long-chain fatty acid transport protein